MTSTPSRTVLVHGATGTQGRPVVRRLLADGHTVHALTRRPDTVPAGVVAVTGDLSDPASLAAAYRDVDAVVVQLPLLFDPQAVVQAQHVLDALAGADVPRAVLNVGGPVLPGPVGVPYLDARSLLAGRIGDVVAHGRSVGPAGPYLENLSAAWSSPLVAAGELRYPLPAEAPVPWVALDDVAAAISRALEDDAPAGRTVLAGPEALTGPELASALSAAVGRPVAWTTISADEYGSMLVPHIGEAAARGIAAAYAPGDGPAPAPDPAEVRTGPTTAHAWAAQQVWGGR
jgi:uncharacterized protein YbjT (DUF2867 family)